MNTKSGHVLAAVALLGLLSSPLAFAQDEDEGFGSGDPDKAAQAPVNPAQWPKEERALYDQWRKSCVAENTAMLKTYATSSNGMLQPGTRDEILKEGFDGAYREKSDRFADEIKDAAKQSGPTAARFGTCLTRLVIAYRKANPKADAQ